MKKFTLASLAAGAFASANAAPVDLSALGTAATDSLSGVSGQLIIVGGVVIGIAGVVMAFRYIKRLIGA